MADEINVSCFCELIGFVCNEYVVDWAGIVCYCSLKITCGCESLSPGTNDFRIVLFGSKCFFDCLPSTNEKALIVWIVKGELLLVKVGGSILRTDFIFLDC